MDGGGVPPPSRTSYLSGNQDEARRSPRPLFPAHEGAVRPPKPKNIRVDVVAVWRGILTAAQATISTRSLNPKKLQQMPFFLAEVCSAAFRANVWWPFPQIREILPELKTQYSLAIVSMPRRLCVPELHRAGLAEFFDPIVISGDYGYRKPDPRLYRNRPGEVSHRSGRSGLHRQRPLPRC